MDRELAILSGEIQVSKKDMEAIKALYPDCSEISALTKARKDGLIGMHEAKAIFKAYAK